MTQQAKNSINLYKGGDPVKIEMLLHFQSNDVVNELKGHFHASDLKELAIKLSLA